MDIVERIARCVQAAVHCPPPLLLNVLAHSSYPLCFTHTSHSWQPILDMGRRLGILPDDYSPPSIHSAPRTVAFNRTHTAVLKSQYDDAHFLVNIYIYIYIKHFVEL